MNKFKPGDKVVINRRCTFMPWIDLKAVVVASSSGITTLDITNENGTQIRLYDSKLDLIEPNADVMAELRDVVSRMRAGGMKVSVAVQRTTTEEI